MTSRCATLAHMATTNPLDLVGALSEAALADLLSMSRPRSFRRGDTLFLEGDDAERGFIIRGGHVKITTATGTGRSSILNVCGSGEIVGEIALLDGGVRTGTATAIDDLDTLMVGRGEFLDLLTRHPDAALAIIGVLCARVRTASGHQGALGTASVPQRVARQLDTLVREQCNGSAAGADTRIELDMTQDELAEWVGASREATARALRTLRGLGVLSTGRRTIIVHRPDDLASFSRI